LHLLKRLHKASFAVKIIFTKRLHKAFKLSQACQLAFRALLSFDTMAAVVIATICAFGLGRKCWRRIKAFSDPMCYGMSKTPFQEGMNINNNNNNNKVVTNQADPELANPPVANNITNAALVVVSTASCCTL
jgi:hypothetical protein